MRFDVSFSMRVALVRALRVRGMLQRSCHGGFAEGGDLL
jgi:hypothetical protein